MKRFLPLLLLGAALALMLSSCAGKHKDDVLFPPLVLAWPGVQDDVQRGLFDGFSDGVLTVEESAVLEARVAALDQAIGDKDSAAVRVGWFGIPGETTSLRPWAERGVTDLLEDGEIGPTGAGSHTERIELFNASVAALPQE